MSLDPLPMAEAAPVCLRIADVTARISGASPRIRADLFALLRPFVLSDPQAGAASAAEVEIALRQSPGRSEWEAWVGGQRVYSSAVYDRLLRHLEWLVVAQAVRQSRRWVVWHAASLARDGQAVALVGESGAGKSTLAVGLARRGWLPLADDLTLFDPLTGALSPFPRCFHVGDTSGSTADSAPPRLEAGADPLTWPTSSLPEYARPTRWADAGATPTWLVVVRRDASQPALLSPISQAQAAGALFAATIQTQATQASGAAARMAVRVASATAGCWELNNSDLDATLDTLEAALRFPPSRALTAPPRRRTT